jgi:hypothetical protein
MAVGTFVAYVGVYSEVAHAEADYECEQCKRTACVLLPR